MNDEKYVVFKKEDFRGVDWAVVGRLADRDITPLSDAVVIRTQDVFAESGLRQYANAIRAHLAATKPSLIRLQEILAITPRHLQRELYEECDIIVQWRNNLDGIADYFDECADEAEDKRVRGEAKVPD